LELEVGYPLEGPNDERKKNGVRGVVDEKLPEPENTKFIFPLIFAMTN
jgi:hypothetical protein